MHKPLISLLYHTAFACRLLQQGTQGLPGFIFFRSHLGCLICEIQCCRGCQEAPPGTGTKQRASEQKECSPPARGCGCSPLAMGFGFSPLAIGCGVHEVGVASLGWCTELRHRFHFTHPGISVCFMLSPVPQSPLDPGDLCGASNSYLLTVLSASTLPGRSPAMQYFFMTESYSECFMAKKER